MLNKYLKLLITRVYVVLIFSSLEMPFLLNCYWLSIFLTLKLKFKPEPGQSGGSKTPVSKSAPGPRWSAPAACGAQLRARVPPGRHQDDPHRTLRLPRRARSAATRTDSTGTAINLVKSSLEFISTIFEPHVRIFVAKVMRGIFFIHIFCKNVPTGNTIQDSTGT